MIAMTSVFRCSIILIDDQNLVWGKKNPMRRVSCLWKALTTSAQLGSFHDPRELTQALTNAWRVIWISEKYEYNS